MVRFLETLIYEKSGAVCEKKWCGYREKIKKRGKKMVWTLLLRILICEKCGVVMKIKREKTGQERKEKMWNCGKLF